MTDAEIMTTVIAAMFYFKGNFCLCHAGGQANSKKLDTSEKNEYQIALNEVMPISKAKWITISI
jgi:hypothetical protein